MSWFSRACLFVSFFLAARWKGIVHVLVTLAVLSLAGVCFYLSCSRLGDVRARAPEVLQRAGFEVVGVQGYEAGLFRCYGGVVSFVVRRTGDPVGHLYELGVSRPGREYHLLDVRCLDCCEGGERR